MVLRGYFDESDRQDGDEPICVAGYIFRQGAYRIFAKRWNRFLKAEGISHLHMTDLYAGKQEYGGLSPTRRAAILGRAVELINASRLAGVAVSFNKAEFEREAPEWFATLQGSIYSSACQGCMRATAFWLGEHSCSQLVAYFFEAGHEFQNEAHAILNTIARAPDISTVFRYQSHRFVQKKAATGLQAADVLAWVIARTRIGGFPKNQTMALFKPHLYELATDSDRYTIQIFEGDKLRRYLAEQLDKPGSYYFKKPPEFRNRLR